MVVSRGSYLLLLSVSFLQALHSLNERFGSMFVLTILASFAIVAAETAGEAHASVPSARGGRHESVAVGVKASLAHVGRHVEQQAPKRMIRAEAQDPGKAYRSRERGAHAAALLEQNADINGVLQFSALDIGKGNGSAYLKSDGTNIVAMDNITCGDQPNSIDACHWEYTASNTSYKFLRLKEPSVCGGDTQFECCLKWDGTAAASTVSMVNCWSDCDGANCQWCMFPITDSVRDWFVPRYSGEDCTATQSACLDAGNCPCLHAEEDTKVVDIQIQGNKGCELSWATA